MSEYYALQSHNSKCLFAENIDTVNCANVNCANERMHVCFIYYPKSKRKLVNKKLVNMDCF